MVCICIRHRGARVHHVAIGIFIQNVRVVNGNDNVISGDSVVAQAVESRELPENIGLA